MELNLSNIRYSKNDIKRQITIPNRITEDLAELMGIILGDGCIGIYKGKSYTHHEITFSGDVNGDMEYYSHHVNELFKQLFNLNLTIRSYESQGNTLYAYASSKAILSFFSTTLGLPTRNKVSRTKIPQIIKDKPIEIKTAFIRGLADTDFCLMFKRKHSYENCYPVISVKQKSREMIENLAELFVLLGFSISTRYDVITMDKRGFESVGSEIYIYGKKNLDKWVNLIGFNNPKHRTKFLVWQKFGFCKPHTTLKQRKEILNSEPGRI